MTFHENKNENVMQQVAKKYIYTIVRTKKTKKNLNENKNENGKKKLLITNERKDQQISSTEQAERKQKIPTWYSTSPGI